MTLIAKRRRFRLLALAKPNLLCFIKHNFYTFKRSALYFFMIAVAKRCFFSKPATAPGIYFARFNHNSNRFTISDTWEAFVGNCFHIGLFIFFQYRGPEIQRYTEKVLCVAPFLCISVLKYSFISNKFIKIKIPFLISGFNFFFQ